MQLPATQSITHVYQRSSWTANQNGLSAFGPLHANQWSFYKQNQEHSTNIPTKCCIVSFPFLCLNDITPLFLPFCSFLFFLVFPDFLARHRLNGGNFTINLNCLAGFLQCWWYIQCVVLYTWKLVVWNLFQLGDSFLVNLINIISRIQL